MNGTLEPGQQFADYTIQALLGQGGMGEVYLAEHLGTGRRVALKVLARELAGDPAFHQRFLRESEIAARLDHPNIVPVEDAGEAGGQLYIVMRYVEGTNFRDLIRSGGPLSPDRAFAILRQVADALDAAHARGVVHRDVKPANILVERPSAPGRGERAYLCDFGLGVRADASSQLTRSGETFGTAAYMAPEQAAGEPSSPRTDAYALACVLFASLTGHPPYRADTMVATIAEHLHAPVPRISADRPDLGTALDAVFQRALAKSPDGRFPTCAAMLTEAAKAIGRNAATAGVPETAGGGAGMAGAAVAGSWGLDHPWDEDPSGFAAADDVMVRYAEAAGAPTSASAAAPPPPSSNARRRKIPMPAAVGALALAAVLLATAGTLAVAATGNDQPEPAEEAAAVATTVPPTTKPALAIGPPPTAAPATEAPPTTQALVSAPAPTEAPSTEAPSTEPPPTEPPSTEAPTTEPPSTEPPSTQPPPTEPPATEPPSTQPPTTQPAPSGPPNEQCVSGWRRPARRKPAGDAIRKATGAKGTLDMVEIRTFVNPDNKARFWYVKAVGITNSPNRLVKFRWLVRRPDGSTPRVVAIAPFNSHGFAGAGWKEFDADVPMADREPYNTMARKIRGCLSGT